MKKFFGLSLLLIFLAVVFFGKNRAALNPPRPSVSSSIGKESPEVVVSRDRDGYGLEITARNFSGVRKVEMVVGYDFRGRSNPPLVASGAPQQNSYWAHFRFESCSRGDCLFYKIDKAKFNLTLSFEDGETQDYRSEIEMTKTFKDLSLVLTSI